MVNRGRSRTSWTESIFQLSRLLGELQQTDNADKVVQLLCSDIGDVTWRDILSDDPNVGQSQIDRQLRDVRRAKQACPPMLSFPTKWSVHLQIAERDKSGIA